MSLETLTLPTNKSVTVINNNVRTLRQSEKGLVLPVIILDANGSAYDLTGKQIIFSENKTEGKIVVDDGTDSQSGKFEVVDAKAGRFNYTLQDQVYSASGEAWFEIKSGDTVLDTTKNFKFNVLEQANIHVNNDNYVSTMNALENHLRGVIQKSEQSINQVSTDLTNSVNQAKNSANAAINSAANNAKTTLANMQNELNSYTAKYQSLENEWKTEQTSIQAKADQQLASLKSTADKARTDAINQINSAKDAAIKTANDNFTQKLSDIQNDYNNWKSKTVVDFQTQINSLKKQLDQENSTATALNSKLSELQKSVDAVKTDFSKVDFTKFVRSVNGITPDNNGNVSLRVGGVNLIRGSEMNSESQKYWKVENVKSGGSVTWDGEVVKVLNADVTQVISVKPNTTYTFSFFLKCLGGSSEGKEYESAFFFVEYTGSGLSKTTSVYNDHKFSGTIFPNTLGRSDKKITFTTQPDCYAIKLIIRQEDTTVHDFEVKELQLEIGDFATDYSPATADVYDAISNAGQVKSVDGKQPDSSGNITIDHYTKAETDSKIDAKEIIHKFDSPQEAYDWSKTGDGIAIYDMNDEATEVVIGDQKVTIETLKNTLDSLSGNMATKGDISTLTTTVNGKVDATSFNNVQNALAQLNNALIGVLRGTMSSNYVKTYTGLIPLSKDTQLVSQEVVQDIIKNMPKHWTGTQAQYDALKTKDANTEYYITDD